MSRNNISHIICLFLLIFCCSITSAKEYATTELKEIAGLLEKKNVPHKEVVDSISNKVIHLGFDLFDNTADFNALMFQRFIERYALRMYLLPIKESSKIMRNDKVTMDVEKISKSPKASFFMVSVDSTAFTASWAMNRASFLRDFALVSGMNKKETDFLFVDKVKSYNSIHKNDSVVSNIKVTSVDSSTYQARVGDSYYIKEMTSDLFYTKAGKDSLLPIYNVEYPKETATNIMQSLVVGDFVLDVEQNMYGYKKVNYSVPLSSFFEICKSEGCITYVGVESVSESEISLVVLYKNEYFSYNHLLNVTFKIEDIKNQKGNLKASLYVYIPTANLKTLFNDKKNEK